MLVFDISIFEIKYLVGNWVWVISRSNHIMVFHNYIPKDRLKSMFLYTYNFNKSGSKKACDVLNFHFFFKF